MNIQYNFYTDPLPQSKIIYYPRGAAKELKLRLIKNMNIPIIVVLKIMNILTYNCYTLKITHN